MKKLTVAFLLSGVVLTGCSGDQGDERPHPRPVTYVTLKMMNPGTTSRLTGSAESWKREDIGFEVAGRVRRVVESGVDIEGRTFDETGKLLTEGTVLAELDQERYRLSLDQAEAAASAATNDIEKGIPAQLAEANAALELAQTELKRTTDLYRDGSITKQALDQAEAAHKRAMAAVAQVEALRVTKRSTLNAHLAKVEQAKVNIRDCQLRAPFAGQIARVHLIPGGYALPGQPVVTVQMMDPMKVNIAVSPETDARVNHNDLVRVLTPNGDELEGMVYLKDTFADPSTRTFLITLLVRNRRIEVGVPDEMKGTQFARCRNLWKLHKAEVGGPGNYYAEVDAIQQDDKGYFVWRAKNLTVPQLYEDFDPVLTVEKVRVKLGEGRAPVLHVFTFRELTDLGDLDPDKDVIVSRISGDVRDGGQILLVRDRWLLRPGDVVQVWIKGETTPEGHYVPGAAIQFDGQHHYVSVAQASGDGYEAARVTVVPGQTVGKLQRIRSTKDELVEGTKIILDGAHYVHVGDKVNPFEEVKLQP